MSFVALTDNHDIAGAIIYWRLSGELEVDDLADALAVKEVPFAPPEIASTKEILLRAAHAALSDLKAQGKRARLRPTGDRVRWIIETLNQQNEDEYTSTYTHNVHLAVETNTAKTKSVSIKPVSPADSTLASKIEDYVNYYDRVLLPVDISIWLSDLTRLMSAVGMRDRGGIYFIPRGEVPKWERLGDVLKKISGHQLYQIPAMRSDDAVAAIVDGLKHESDEVFNEFENYLQANDLSTRGLNAWSRDLQTISDKIRKYKLLLQVELPEITARAEKLIAASVAAKLKPVE